MFFRAQDAPDTPKMALKDIKMAPKTFPRGLPDLQEAPKIPPRRSKMPSRRPKTSLRRSKRPSRAAKTTKMTPKTRPRYDLGGFGEPRWSRVGTKIVSKSISSQKRRKALWYWKSCYFFNKITFPGAKKNDPNFFKNHSKLEVYMGRPLDMDCCPFLYVFSGPRRSRRSQDGSQRRQDGSQDVSKRPPRQNTNLASFRNPFLKNLKF